MWTRSATRCRWVLLSAVVLTTASSAAASEVSGPGVLLVAAPAELETAASAWAELRRASGWHVERLTVDPAATPETVRAAMHERLDVAAAGSSMGQAVGPRRAILLLGDVDRIPPFRYVQRDAQLRSRRDDGYISDHAYRAGDDGRPIFELGRIPARTNDEALSVLAKIRRYESAPGGAWRRRVAYVAGEGRFGAAADGLLEWLFTRMIDQLVPPVFDVSMLYAKADSIYCPAPSVLADTALAAFAEDALLVNYVGHGSARAFDALQLPDRRERILDVGDLDRFAPLQPPGRPIAVLTCCSAGWYDLPDGERSMAEAMLLHPSGPIAVLAGSRITHPYANAVLQKDVTHELLVRRSASLGELDLAVTRSMLDRDLHDTELDLVAAPVALIGRWPSSLDELRRMHARLYNLFGDPTVRIAQPPPIGIELRRHGNTIEGAVRGMSRGVVLIALETSRTEIACPPCLSHDADLEVRLARNFGVANERVLERIDAPVRDGAFRVTLPSGWPPRARVIKAHASGVGDDGREAESVGVLLVR